MAGLPIDLAVLDKIAPDTVDKIDILKDFIAETQSDLTNLDEALKRDDFPAATHIAHCIKGAGAMIGAHDLAARCAAVELASQQAVVACTDAVKAELERLSDFFDKVLAVDTRSNGLG